ncbi:ribosome recycling factor [Candidatus Ichthyocystis hellenicum]|uniref:ribosome recycling factor n=1 Tax=Candidatus Ichthyocystis hellenicum TaxID=1561003 RepID=UPI000A5F2DAC|nr:ribosome recycling factor [Candidatus Ichthyocystis hellenicum]
MDSVYQVAQTKMERAMDSLRSSLSKIRTGRASTAIVEDVLIPYYGSSVPLKQIASLTLGDSRTIIVQPWEKHLLPVIEKAIRDAADSGLNPVTRGAEVCVPMPPLSEERRRDLAKIVRSECELGRVSVRNIRREANSSLKESMKKKEISEDEEHNLQDKIQKLTDRFVEEIDRIMQDKEAEVMTI